MAISIRIQPNIVEHLDGQKMLKSCLHLLLCIFGLTKPQLPLIKKRGITIQLTFTHIIVKVDKTSGSLCKQLGSIKILPSITDGKV